MTIDRELLWKAWPDGYLAMRGVQTIGHWQCRWSAMAGRFGEFTRAEGNLVQGDTGLGPIRRIIVNGAEPATRDDEGEHTRGDLLPNIDPTDRATWACLLHDLGTSIGWTETWALEHWPADGAWVLCGPNEIRHAFEFETNDPALALVLARIQTREKS